MLEELKKWYDLLCKDGINSKKIVREEILKKIKELENAACV